MTMSPYSRRTMTQQSPNAAERNGTSNTPQARAEMLKANIRSVYLGDEQVVERVLIALLGRGHILLEDVPGVGKTLLAGSLAASIDCSFGRIQLTPDLLPSDVVGVNMYKPNEGVFEFKPGPLFANIVLADEVNRTPPRTQAALLEAMSESGVTVDGTTHRLHPPFMVIATQNPYTFEGTYPLPESQLDRFLIRTQVGYPTPEAESRVLEQRPLLNTLPKLDAVMTGPQVVELQAAVDEVKLNEDMREYIIALATRTREGEDFWLGVSPRGSLALAQAARAQAMLRGRDYVVPDDVYELFIPVCGHRVLLSEGRRAEPAEVHSALETVLSSVPSPA